MKRLPSHIIAGLLTLIFQAIAFSPLANLTVSLALQDIKPDHILGMSLPLRCNGRSGKPDNPRSTREPGPGRATQSPVMTRKGMIAGSVVIRLKHL